MTAIPSKIGKYKITSLVGEGGMGAVYKATHPTLQRDVIIKKLTLMGNRSFAERFKREATIMMDFRNEHIVQVFDHFQEGAAYYIVMEYVDGITLERLIKEKRYLSNNAALLIFNEICAALRYAHNQKIIHRDIKPSNILISKEGVVKLVDFGVSTSLEESEMDGLTLEGMTLGTPSYLAPEQIQNATNRDKRADIYSLGVVFYEMVTGKKPFKGGFTPELIRAIEGGKYKSPRKVNPQVQRFVQRIIKKTMHKNVKRRFQDLGVIVKKLSGRFKQLKDQIGIEKAIQEYSFNGKEIFLNQNKGQIFGMPLKVSSMLFIWLFFVIGGMGLWSYFNELQYEYLYPEEYGALQVSILAKKEYKQFEDLYIQASIYKENQSGLRKLNDLEIAFQLKSKDREKGRIWRINSNKIYLESGNYMLLLYYENQQLRKNFYLAPRSIQNFDARTIGFRANEILPKLPVEFSYQIASLTEKKSLQDQATLYILDRGKWKKWKQFKATSGMENPLVSGMRYRFRVKAKGYFTRNYVVTVQPEQTSVKLDIKLTPLPGVVNIKSDLSNVAIQLNQSDFYLSGEKQRRYTRLKSLTPTYQKIILTPDNYQLTAKWAENLIHSASTSKIIDIQSGRNTYIDISKGTNNGTLLYTVRME